MLSVYKIEDQGLPPAVGISDGLSDVVVLVTDIVTLVELLQVYSDRGICNGNNV
jgi:hypothetical protein